MANNMEDSIKKIRDAAVRLLPQGWALMDPFHDGSRIFLQMPAPRPAMYHDYMVAWIINRTEWHKDRKGGKCLGSQMVFKGSELIDDGQTQQFFDERVMDALSRPEQFDDGGILPVNDHRLDAELVNG